MEASESAFEGSEESLLCTTAFTFRDNKAIL